MPPDAVKSLLKKIFPRLFLKKAFGIYNRLKIATIDRILYSEYPVKAGEFMLFRKGYPFRESKIDITGIDDVRVRTYMQQWFDWTQEEFILEATARCVIEPDYGWAIFPGNKLLFYSLGISRTGFLPKPAWFRFRRRHEMIEVDSCISLRDTGEENYFHLYNDVLAKIFFLKESGIAIEEIPFLISKKVWDSDNFQGYRKKSPLLNSLKWILQDKQYVTSKRTIFCKPLTHRRALLDAVISPLKISATGTKRIFLARRPGSLRFIENAAEIEAVLISREIDTIYAEDHTLEEQIIIFANASFVAGIHGAGFTNLLFRQAPCSVLEIFPPPEQGYLPFHYVMIAKMQGFDYQALIGDPGRRSSSGGFIVDAQVLKKQLDALGI